MITTATLAMLHRAILLDPADDLARLVLADLLEEDGQDEQAEYIRDAIAICYPERLNPDHDMGANWDGVIDIITQYSPPEGRDHCSLCAAIVRQRISLQPKYIAADIGELVGMPADWSGRKDTGAPYVGVRCRGGFAYHLRCPLSTWEAHAAAVCASHPVQRVELTDREPGHPSDAEPAGPLNCVGWWGDRNDEGAYGTEDLPWSIWKQLDGWVKCFGPWKWYPTPAAAHAALSLAAVSFGRQKEGLPVLGGDREEGSR